MRDKMVKVETNPVNTMRKNHKSNVQTPSAPSSIEKALQQHYSCKSANNFEKLSSILFSGETSIKKPSSQEISSQDTRLKHLTSTQLSKEDVAIAFYRRHLMRRCLKDLMGLVESAPVVRKVA